MIEYLQTTPLSDAVSLMNKVKDVQKALNKNLNKQMKQKTISDFFK